MQQRAHFGQASRGAAIGQTIHELASRLYPICRSITGAGVRESLSLLSEHLDIAVCEVPTGTQVFDWIIPREWTIRDAYIADEHGKRIVDFRVSNLHVLNYSAPISGRFTLAELKKHIFTLPDQPDLIPYRTSYYVERWGFCMQHNVLSKMTEGIYEAVIDSSLTDGSLRYGECVLPGEKADEVLLSAHICHPSLANDNCSGLALLTILATELRQRRLKHTYRILFAPGTIGSIAWLARNEGGVHRIRHGLIVSCVGDRGGPTYKKSRRGDAMIDRVMQHVLRQATPSAVIQDFSPYGYDERQFCSPAFNLPVGLFQRSQFGTFPEYHTSADDLAFIRPEWLTASYEVILEAIEILEADRTLINTNPRCEPALGRRGLYSTIGGDADAATRNMAMLWLLNLSDGTASLFDIAERSGMAFAHIDAAARQLEAAGLLVSADEGAAGPSSGARSPGPSSSPGNL